VVAIQEGAPYPLQMPALDHSCLAAARKVQAPGRDTETSPA
jgi:hypothetical protein